MNLCKAIKDKTGLNLTAWAKQLNVSRQCLYESSHGNGSRRVRIAIAIVLNTSPNELFVYENEHKRVLDVHEFEKQQRGKK